MKKTKTVAKKAAPKKAGKKPAPKKAPSKSEAQKEKKLMRVGDYLQEIFHLAGHSIEAGEEAPTPLIEIAMIALSLHNEEERDPGHKMSGVKFICECKEKEHTLMLKEYHDECHS